MRKVIIIAAIALGTLALAQARGFGNASQSSGNDWYNQVQAQQVDQNTRINDAVAPSQTQFAESAGDSAAGPGSMASNAQSGSEWYDQKVQAEATLNGRVESAIRVAPSL